MVAGLLAACAAPLSAQRGRRGSSLAVGVGIGRFMPQRPIATADGMPDYTLKNAAATSVKLDYWWRSWVATRVGYEWVRTGVSKPNVPSFGRIYTVSGAVLLAPVQLPMRRSPYLALGGGVRRYNINSTLSNGGPAWDIAPNQNRPAAYGGVGAGLSLGGILIVPEAGVWTNTFKHEYRCNGCTDTSDEMDVVLTLHLVFAR